MKKNKSTFMVNYKTTIIEQFEDIVKKYPNNVALVGDSRILSYLELSTSVNILAEQLLNINLNTKFIYLLFEHDVSMVIAILATLKNTKAYIPLDPTHPLERSSYIISDSKGEVMLTNSRNLQLAMELAENYDLNIKIINIDNNESFSADNKFNSIPQKSSSDDLAYVLYTSGSTGKPKGVIQNNKNVLFFISKYTRNLHITEVDRLTLFSTYTFDASLMDIYGALLNGASLYIYSIKRPGAIDGLKDWIRNNEITIFHSVPTLYRYFILKIGKDLNSLNSVRLVVMGGEPVLINDVELYKKYFSDNCIFINGLGPTESTVTLQYHIEKSTIVDTASVPVGYPIEQTEVYILNDAGCEAKTDEIGELIYKSDYLALGYLNLDEETKKVFIDDPITKNGRVFKTGDLGKRNRDGLIEFYGRNDFQIKIRGYRIELNEIESILDKHSLILKSVIMPIKLDGKESQIIAYYSTDKKEMISEIELRDYLSNLLPEYMIPTHFLHLDDFPLTATGKIDRKHIVNNFRPKINSHKLIMPRDKIEEEIFLLWQNVLNDNNLSIDTEFIKAGGDSLMATTIVLELQDMYDMDIALSDLAELNTIEKMAIYVKGRMR